MCRLVFLSWLQFVQCWCILFLFYLTVLIACMICFYYNVCDCHAFIKGNLLTYFKRIPTRLSSLDLKYHETAKKTNADANKCVGRPIVWLCIWRCMHGDCIEWGLINVPKYSASRSVTDTMLSFLIARPRRGRCVGTVIYQSVCLCVSVL